MKKSFQRYLFDKHILVSENAGQGAGEAFYTLYTLANKFSISITEGKELAQEKMIPFVSEVLRSFVPAPFYEGFPQTVRELSPDQLLFDQMVHYAMTYGFGQFDTPGHSLFEKNFQRTAFRENCIIKEFVILKEDEARARLDRYAEDLLASTRPLNDRSFEFLAEYVADHGGDVKTCASKNTAIRLLVRLRDLRFTKFLVLSDAIKVADEINWSRYFSQDLRKLNFRNQDRKFMKAVLDKLLGQGRVDLENCYEKKAIWCGLLHHIHYKPKSELGEAFVAAMRGRKNGSVWSAFEEAMGKGNVKEAVNVLIRGKGAGALLRNLDYVISRIQTPEDLSFVLGQLETKNNLILMQLLQHYNAYGKHGRGLGRTFTFTRHSQLWVHSETPQEVARRKSRITRGQAQAISAFLEENLRKNLKNKLGKVYVDEGMKRIALPISETASQGGYGVLAKGSRIPLPEGKKIRAFTYWEKINDIDLSVVGMEENGTQREFSWRNMAGQNSGAIVFSGDETSGYNGGSEYFDVDLEEFQRMYPTVKYLVFCDNVFSGERFDDGHCTAGFMMRDLLDSGEVFEPKTVETAFCINGASTFAYLFGVDLRCREMVWLNLCRAGGGRIAGNTGFDFMEEYFEATKVLSVHRFFEMAATELVSDPAEADIVVSDRKEDARAMQGNGSAGQADARTMQGNGSIGRENMPDADGGKRQEWIHSYDHERLLSLMNTRS